MIGVQSQLMRSFLAGLVILLLSTAAFGQVSGFVESIGYQNSYRPDCWTPMLVNLTSQFGEAVSYQLQVWQEDLDRDRVVYTKDITLSPRAQDKFQLYFIPRATEGGIANSPADALHVRLCFPPKENQRPEDAKVVIDRLPVRFPVDNLDPDRTMLASRQTGTKLVLYVTDRGEQPAVSAYDGAVGLMENIRFVRIPITELGENVLYYQSVDAVLWLDADADALDRGGAKRLEALEEYVRLGGSLVVCQPTERGRISAFAPILPVELKDAADNWQVEITQRPSFDVKLDALPQLSRKGSSWNSSEWTSLRGPFDVARPHKLKPDAVVEAWDQQNRDDLEHPNPNRSPYLVRHPFGMGAVSWVGQSLGSPNLKGPAHWPVIWDHVFGWNNDTYILSDIPSANPNFQNNPRLARQSLPPGAVDVDGVYGQNSNAEQPVDLGHSANSDMEFTAKGAAYIFVAILFFIGYWIVAGPGTYLFLVGKKRKELNWFVFGLWAFVATALTLGVVRLLLRGAPEIRHHTVVRVVPNEPALVQSGIGLYIPQDGYQTIELKENAKDQVSFVSPFPVNPIYAPTSDYPAAQDYSVPIHDDPQPVKVSIPFRSTLKKLQGRWIGDLQTGASGTAKLNNINLEGTLTNQTGVSLDRVFFIYRPESGTDQILYTQDWYKNETINLKERFDKPALVGIRSATEKKEKRGDINAWAFYEWYPSFSGRSFTGDPGHGDENTKYVMMSLIDRLPPDKTIRSGTTVEHARVDFLRRGGHDLNVSPAIAAGQLVILAEAHDSDRPLPFPLDVNGAKVSGQGRVLYQIIVPLERAKVEMATTP